MEHPVGKIPSKTGRTADGTVHQKFSVNLGACTLRIDFIEQPIFGRYIMAVIPVFQIAKLGPLYACASKTPTKLLRKKRDFSF